MPRHESNINRDYKEPRFRLVCSCTKEANEFVCLHVDLLKLLQMTILSAGDYRVSCLSVTACVELLIDRSALLSICSADKKLWICVTELTVYKKKQRVGGVLKCFY